MMYKEDAVQGLEVRLLGLCGTSTTCIGSRAKSVLGAVPAEAVPSSPYCDRARD